jgi:hypothetical protein
MTATSSAGSGSMTTPATSNITLPGSGISSPRSIPRNISGVTQDDKEAPAMHLQSSTRHLVDGGLTCHRYLNSFYLIPRPGKNNIVALLREHSVGFILQSHLAIRSYLFLLFRLIITLLQNSYKVKLDDGLSRGLWETFGCLTLAHSRSLVSIFANR